MNPAPPRILGPFGSPVLELPAAGAIHRVGLHEARDGTPMLAAVERLPGALFAEMRFAVVGFEDAWRCYGGFALDGLPATPMLTWAWVEPELRSIEAVSPVWQYLLARFGQVRVTRSARPWGAFLRMLGVP